MIVVTSRPPEVPVVIDHPRAEPQPHFEPWLTRIRAWTRDSFGGRDWWRWRGDVIFVTRDAHLLWRGDLTGIKRSNPPREPARLSVKNCSAIKTVNYQGHTQSLDVLWRVKTRSSHIYGWCGASGTRQRDAPVSSVDAGVHKCCCRLSWM